MKIPLLNRKFLITITFLLGIGLLNAQVGINTTTPANGAMLDVSSTDKGILIPRVALNSTINTSPITPAPTTSLLAYNTATAGSGATSVSPGFYYWSGTSWIPILSNDWKQSGNTGTSPAANFVGTIDNIGLSFRTNNTERLQISNTGSLHASMAGTAASPVYSWGTDQDTGIWRSGDNQLNISAGGLEFVEFRENTASALVINDTNADMNTRIATANNANSVFVDGANDNIGLGTGAPNISAQLDMGDNDRGILVNRVALTATNLPGPVASPSNGLLVFNTATASSGSTEVLPGFYYWYSGRWIAMGGTGGRDWSLDGNAGTLATSNFVGTTDSADLIFKTNDVERMRFLDTGTAGIAAAPYTNVALRVSNSAEPFGILGETSSNGAAVYGIDTNAGIGVRGENTGTGLGLYGFAANSHGAYTYTTYTGGAFLIGGIQAWGGGANGANGVLAVSDLISVSASNMGLRAVSGSTTSISSSDILNVGVNTNATDLSLYALTEGPITSLGTIEAARFQTNYTGNAITADARDPRAQLAGYTTSSQVGGGQMYYGGYMYSGGSSSNSSYAYAGARYNGTNYKIIGNGAVSTIVEDTNGGKKVMFAAEAPEVLFEDYGTGQLVNGSANIRIDPILSNNIVVDTTHPLKVFIQLEGDCNGVFVTNKTANSFTVKELRGGSANVAFSYHIVANRKDDIGNSGTEASAYSSLRFPDAPEGFYPETLTAKEMQKFDPLLSVTDAAGSLNNE